VGEIKVCALALLGIISLVGFEDAVDDDSVAWEDSACQVVLQLDVQGLRLLSTPKFFWRLLYPDLLSVNELGLIEDQFERSAPVASLILALQVLVLKLVARLFLKESKAAALALEGG
jgi:hypothetical protein